jgi:formate hydrogenlyase transcriptional activator
MASRRYEPQSKHFLEAELQATLNLIPAYTWYADSSGALTFVNERLANYLGLPNDDPLRFGTATGAQWDSHIPLLHPDDHEETRRVWSTCLRTNSAGEVSFRVRNAEGRYRWFLSRAEPLRASDGTLLYWLGVNLDIEERKQAEFYLAEGQRLAHMGSWAFNASGFDYWSSELFQIHGLDPTGKPPTVEEYLDLVHTEDRGFVKQEIEKMLVEHRGFDFTKRIVRPDGKIRSLRCVGVPRTHGETFLGFVGTGIDVTEQEQLTQELQHREAYLAEAQRLSHTGSFGWSVSSGEIFWSDETFRIFQCPKQMKPTLEFVLSRVHPNDRELVQQQIARASRDSEGFDFEHRLQLPDGSVNHVRVTAHPSRDSAGNLEFVGAVTDVSEQRDAEAVIREQEAELREVVDTIPAILWSALPDGSNSYVNSRYVEYCGMPPEQIAGSGWHAATHPDDLERHNAKWLACVASGEPSEDELRFRRADGEYRWHLVRGVPLRDEAGNIVKWYGVVTDIEDRKRAEDKIREQESELRQIVDLAPQLVAVFGPGHERLYANRILLDYLGLTLEEWRQRFNSSVPTYSNEFLHPDDWERVTGDSDRALSRGAAFELEMRLRKSDGSYRWFLARYNPLHDEEGQITRWYVTGTDIEDRKQAEDRLRQENVALREEIDKASMFEEIVGTSPALKSVLSRISKVAPSDSTVLITGETGTGKELVARAIHRRSDRASRAFVSVNCAAIPRDLIASELFGHEKGAFTGATQQRLGRFELANGGTIFLDEVGELPAETQIALLRVLQEHEFERVGGTRRIRTDVRVIAATNRDLQVAISAGSFRSDLFYRLHVFPIEIPSLRERKEDTPLLVEYFIDRYARKAGKNIKRVNKKTLELLQSYPWPGNIRELQNVIERSVILCETETFSIDESWLPQQPQPFLTAKPKNQIELPRRLEEQEKDMIEEALKASRGRVFGPTGAAAKLGIPRSTLESKIKSLKIDKNRFKTDPEG